MGTLVTLIYLACYCSSLTPLVSVCMLLYVVLHQVLCDMWAMSREASVTHMEETMVTDGDLTHEMSMKGFTALKADEVCVLTIDHY
jgi:hypothetical protein